MSLTGNNGLLAAAGANQPAHSIERSVVLDTNSYFTRTPSSAGNRKTYTLSFWAKLSQGSNGIGFGQYSDSSNRVYFRVQPAGFSVYSVSGGSADCDVSGSFVFRDPSAWYHIVIVVDTTESTASNRIKLWVNGSSKTLTHTTSWTQNTDTRINDTNQHTLGLYNNTAYPDGYLAEVNFIDGTALTPASFGETNEDTNQWQAINYTGSYGTNGFYLDFATRATDPIDASGNGNNWGSVNVLAGDWKIDSPTNNFATLNPLGVSDYNKWTLNEGNLKAVNSSNGFGEATFQLSSGKWYFEVDHTDNGGKNGLIIALVGPDDNWTGGPLDERLMDGLGTGLYGVSIDMDAGSFATTLNGSASSSGSFTPQDCKIAFVNGNSANAKTFIANFGQDSSFGGARTAQGNGGVGEDFYYTPPSGYKALNTDNLDDPAIALPGDHFNTVLYVGTQSAGNSITNVGFKPDFVWLKDKDHAQNHGLFDVVRGVNKQIMSNSSVVEITAYSDLLTSFDTDGFTLGADLSVGDINHYSGGNYVSWSWKGGGTASSNSDGTITSSVSANTTAGFSIVSYTGNSTAGATVGHGLSQAPDLVIAKERTHQDSWLVFSEPLGNTKALFLNGTSGSGTHTTYWNNTSPSSTVVTLGSDNKGNGSGTMIMYCFHSVDGYSKVGSYTGNGSTDGAFVYTSFKPQWLLVKETGAAGNWIIWDVKRSEFNVMNDYLLPNSTAANAVNAAVNVDFVSNGFKWRNSDNDMNGNGGSYIYLAFAESPFKYANAR